MSEPQQRGGFGGNKNTRRFDGGGSGRPNFGGQYDKRGGNVGGRPTQLFKATCSHCGKPCEVPFRPSGDKPVYCKECFMRRKENLSRGEGRRETGARDFEKRGVSPAFSPAPQGGSVRLDDLKRQIDSMNTKLDSVLQKLGGAGSQATKQAEGKVRGTAKRAAKKSRKSSKSSKK